VAIALTPGAAASGAGPCGEPDGAGSTRPASLQLSTRSDHPSVLVEQARRDGHDARAELTVGHIDAT
jgi:hypothetical protein